jgi:hypothetical protein
LSLLRTIPQKWILPLCLVLLSFYFDFLFEIEIEDRLKIIFNPLEFDLLRFGILKLILIFGLIPIAIKSSWKYQLTLAVSSIFFLLPNVTYASFFALPVWFVAGLAVFQWILIIPIKSPVTFNFSVGNDWIKKGAIFLVILTTLSVLWLYFDVDGSVRLTHFLLQNDIYEARSNTSENISTLGKYLMSWTVNLLIPLSVVLSYKNHKILAVLGVLLGLALFGFNPHKTILFNMFLALTFSVFSGFQFKLKWLLSGFAFLLIVGRVEALLFNSHVPMIEGFMVRRLLFLPAYLNQCYLEYFTEPIYLSHSILKTFVSDPFILEPSEVIGEMAYPGSGAHANNGIFSDGFMNFGFVGFWLWLIAAGMIIAFMLSTAFTPEMIVFIILVINTFKSSPLLTSLKNHAVLPILIIFLLIQITATSNQSADQSEV